MVKNKAVEQKFNQAHLQSTLGDAILKKSGNLTLLIARPIYSCIYMYMAAIEYRPDLA